MIIRLQVVIVNFLLILLLATSCNVSQEPGNNRTYHGLEGFGYQWDNPSPYGEWVPQRKENASSLYHFSLTGPNGYIEVHFFPINSLNSLPDALNLVLGLEPTEYKVLIEQVLNSDSQMINDYRIKEYEKPDKLYIRLAMFQFDSDHWAIVYGQPASGKERRFNDAFETILFSLKPFRNDPNNSSKE